MGRNIPHQSFCQVIADWAQNKKFKLTFPEHLNHFVAQLKSSLDSQRSRNSSQRDSETNPNFSRWGVCILEGSSASSLSPSSSLSFFSSYLFVLFSFCVMQKGYLRICVAVQALTSDMAQDHSPRCKKNPKTFDSLLRHQLRLLSFGFLVDSLSLLFSIRTRALVLFDCLKIILLDLII